MPYIETKDVAAIRRAIKAALPDYVLSVTKHHHSTVQVHIMSGPIVDVPNVNVYWFKDHLGPDKLDRPDAIEVIDKIITEIFKVRTPKTLVEDGDYGTVPTFYYDVRFGKWDKPYVCTDPDADDKLAIQQSFRQIDRFNEQEARYAAYKAERETKLRLVS
jgi:hypothetical protein